MLAGAIASIAPDLGPAVAATGPHVSLRTVTITERRALTLPNGRVVPRALVTYVRIPAGRGPFPLIVFAHGFAVTPTPYRALLTAWARAGFAVAAPVFPLENAGAPGGPTQSDLINEPGDVSAVITYLIRRSRTPGSPFFGAIDPRTIAVAGQSDGGIAALATGFGDTTRDRRVRAAIVLSGSELGGFGGYDFGAAGAPALLAAQGTADTTNLPLNTYRFFAAASAPKFLLRLLGAGHLPPYTTEQAQLTIVEGVSIAFLRRYLQDRGGALGQITADGDRAGLAAVTAYP